VKKLFFFLVVDFRPLERAWVLLGWVGVSIKCGVIPTGVAPVALNNSYHIFGSLKFSCSNAFAGPRDFHTNTKLPKTRIEMLTLGTGLRRLALRPASIPFICSQCLPKPVIISPPSRIIHIVRSRAFAGAKPQSTLASAGSTIAAEQAAAATQQSASQSSKKSFPDTSSKSVAYWLLGSAASVFGIVVFGGLTRLTESG
jgi:hypothetical protein